jgi:hypothetical protein
MKKILKFLGFAAIGVAALVGIGLVVCSWRPGDIHERAEELRAYCEAGGYNADYAILVDYGRVSVQKRLYVYDFNRGKVVMQSLAGHGSGGESTILKADFSDVPGSHCSSLVHYRVGRNRRMYNRPLVPAFELIGLDKTNANALDRGILIHPSAGPLSWGCVMLPLYKYHQLSEFLNTQSDVILWAYDNMFDN